MQDVLISFGLLPQLYKFMNTIRSDIILYYIVAILANIAGSGETYQNKLCNLNFIPTILDVFMSNYNNKNLVIVLLSSLMNITYSIFLYIYFFR